MPKPRTWADVNAGMRVELKGREYVVTKIKPKGKRAVVVVVGGGGRFESEVKVKDAVKIIKAAKPDKSKLRSSTGQMNRWATEKEHARAVPQGDAGQTTPPRPAMGEAWETPVDKVERKLAKVLGAHLVGEATDESSGYYVPPVDVTTIAAHLALFHGTDVSAYGIDDLVELHRNEHESALAGQALHVNHWHTKERPGNA